MNRFLKWLLIAIGGLAGIVVIILVVSYFVSEGKLSKTYDTSVPPISVVADSASIAHGAHLTTIYGCRNCHSGNLGGQVFIDAPPFRIVASNLTAGEGGVGSKYSNEDYVRAIRFGIRPDGHSLLMMPNKSFYHFSDGDLAAIIAYIRSVPPVGNDLPKSELHLMGRVITTLAGMGLAADNVDRSLERVPNPGPAPTATFGRYLFTTACMECHGEHAEGGPNPDPNGMAIPPLDTAAGWSTPEFMTTIRTGTNPAGRALDPDQMPWKSFRSMTDEELTALHSYLGELTAKTSAETTTGE
jgi:mono/diheme cytochrome c family protein